MPCVIGQKGGTPFCRVKFCPGPSFIGTEKPNQSRVYKRKNLVFLPPHNIEQCLMSLDIVSERHSNLKLKGMRWKPIRFIHRGLLQ